MCLYESLVLVFFCFFVSVILPRLKVGIGTCVTAVLLGGLVLINRILDPLSNLWVKSLLPGLILVVGYFIFVAHHILVTKKTMKTVPSDLSEKDKALGLFYHQQGMLDLAFEKFQSMPLEGDVNDVLYSLGLEYEKKGQIKKALDVYKTMARKGLNNEPADEGLSKFEQTEPETLIRTEGHNHPAMPLKVDARVTVGRYEVSEAIGQDPMGAIFRGRDSKNGTAATIKTLAFTEFEDDHLSEIRDRFRGETKCLKQLVHPNIVSVYECGEDQGMFYIATEDLEAEELKNHTKKGQLLPIRETLSIIGCVAEALDYAHKKDVIHQCIRPDSIVRMKKTKVVKVKDFGIGWIPSVFDSKEGTPIDSHFYMSPEQITGKKVDGRSDIFSLGVGLFEMLTGEKPFGGEDPTSVLLKISKEKQPSPRLYNPKIPRVVEKIIDRTLEKNLEKRYQSAGQIAIHLKKVVARIDVLLDQKKSLNP